MVAFLEDTTDRPVRGQPQRPFPWYGWLGAGALGAGELGLALGLRPVRTGFYLIAWWSYILLADACVARRRGASLLSDRPREFCWLAFWSVPIWSLFELFNFRLQDWCYVNVLTETPAAALLCFAAYATVLPGIFETHDLLASLGLAARARCRPLRVAPRLPLVSVALGLGMLAAALLWPGYAFPLVWGFAVLLSDPVCYWAGPSRTASLIGQLEQGNPRTLLRLLAAGLVCGGLWEFWNFWAYTKWLYTVPLFEELKWFEMPPLGFLGFPPFALTCYAMVNLLVLVRRGRKAGSGLARPMAVIVGLGALAFDVAIYAGITRWSVASYAPTLADLDGVPRGVLDRLAESGVRFPPDLLSWTAAPERLAMLAREAGVPREELERLREAARLADLKGMGAANANALARLGITTVAGLAREEAERLLPAWRARAAERPPTLPQARLWIRAAKRQADTDEARPERAP